MQTPSHIIELIETNKSRREPVLDLRGQSLLSIPAEIQSATHLQRIMLNNNAIQHLPAWLNDLHELQFIVLNINPLQSVGDIQGLVLDWGVWRRLQPKAEQVAGLWLRWEDDAIIHELMQLPNLRWLDLSEQRLRQLPTPVVRLKELQVLSLCNNSLNRLQDITQLQNLTQLNLNHNHLSQLPAEITTLQNLTWLDLSFNSLNQLPAEMATLQNLTRLDLSDNNLNQLPAEITALQNLTGLNLSHNGLSQLPGEITTLQNLTRLDLSHNDLSQLPGEITTLQNLTQLDLSHNGLSQLPAEMVALQNLTWLDLSHNNLNQLPPEISTLQNLTLLNLSGNRLSQLPAEIATLQNLTQLHLSGNDLSQLPVEITTLQNLTQLHLDYNNLSQLPAEIATLQNLTQLDLSYNNLSQLPTEITTLQNLTRLHLNNNNLSQLPAKIAILQNLTQLDLSYNNLSQLQTEIGTLQNLTQLHLNGNNLSQLPAKIAILQNLTQLDLSYNNLSQLPTEIGTLQSLTQLHLSGNNLSQLPTEITTLQNLTRLNLNGNDLSQLPAEISTLQNLTRLTLHKNPLNQLPSKIAQLHDLRTLTINTVEIPPLESLDLEHDRVNITKLRAWFRQVEQSGLDYLYEAKLLIVGEGGAGKTSFLRRVQDEQAPLPKTDESTRGIEIVPWEFTFQDKKTQTQKTFRVNFWDFGGQQIYHSTHQFFLTKRSLYVLVADTRKDDTVFYDWLNMVTLFSQNSPVLIIKNQKDDRAVELDEASLRERFNNFERSFACNIATNAGREEVLQFIQYRIQQLPHIGQVLPKSWLKVRIALEKEAANRPYLAFTEYEAICAEHGFTRDDDKLQLSDYLHDLGVCLHFQADELLRRTVILQPTWGTDAVYQVLDNETIKAAHGRFGTQDLTNIWQAPKYKDMRPELLQLMINFKLCYALTEPNCYIAPQLLNKQKPEYNWPEENNLQLRYTYPRFMPKGILNRLIVAIHALIENRRQRAWLHGVVLSNHNTRAEVREDVERREIRIRLCGDHQRDLLTTVVSELEKIHQSFHDLEYTQQIPCCCSGCSGKPEPEFYSYTNLKRFQKDGQTTIQCQASYQQINVRQLIDNVIDEQRLDDVIDEQQLPLDEPKPPRQPLEKLTLKGFKSIKNLNNFHLTQLNLLIGGNGAGKSNFLDFFRLLRAMMNLPLPNLPNTNLKAYIADSGGSDDFLFNGPKITEHIQIETKFGPNRYRCKLSPTSKNTFIINEEQRYDEAGSSEWWNLGSGHTASELLSDKNKKIIGEHNPSFYIYEAIASWKIYHFHDTSKTAAMRRYHDVDDCDYLRFDAANIAPYLLKLRHDNQSTYENIVETIRLVTPFFDDFILQPGANEKIQLRWKQQGADYPLKAQHLSDGTLRFICLTTALLQPIPPSTLIIDEPELGLHPYAIAILAELIQAASETTQLIISTQSPILIDYFEPEDIVVVNRKEGTSVFERLNKNDLSSWLDSYTLGELWQKEIISGGPVHE